MEAAPEGPEWVARPWVAVTAVTEVAGKAKAAGKTTWLIHLIRSVLNGEPFLDQPTMQTPVVYLTEEKPGTLTEALKRAGLAERDDLHFLMWHETKGKTWSQVVEAAIDRCRQVHAKMLVVDTLPQFAGFKGDAENNAGDALQALVPLQLAASLGIAVAVVRHERKSGGDPGQAGRGSSAFAGAVDIVISINRPRDAAEDNTIRLIRALSRFDETPEQVTVKLTDDGYDVVSWGEQTAVDRMVGQVLDALNAEAAAETGLTVDELQTAVHGSRTTVQAVLKKLKEEARVVETGRGVRGDPFRYRRIVSAETVIPIEAERNIAGLEAA